MQLSALNRSSAPRLQRCRLLSSVVICGCGKGIDSSQTMGSGSAHPLSAVANAMKLIALNKRLRFTLVFVIRRVCQDSASESLSDQVYRLQFELSHRRTLGTPSSRSRADDVLRPRHQFRARGQRVLSSPLDRVRTPRASESEHSPPPFSWEGAFFCARNDAVNGGQIRKSPLQNSFARTRTPPQTRVQNSKEWPMPFSTISSASTTNPADATTSPTSFARDSG